MAKGDYVVVQGEVKQTPSGEWREVAVNQLGRIITGKTPSSRNLEYFGGTIPFVTPTDMNGRRLIDSTERYLTDTGADSVGNAHIPPGSVMVSCIGSDMGKAAIAAEACVTNQQINTILVDSENDPLFVYYNLSNRKDEIKGSAGGSAQPILKKSDFGRLLVRLPPLPEQQAIAHVLGTLDDKIELNRRMNETLEAMARALFKSWFVDFDPVRAKMEGHWRPGESLPGLPADLYDLFPDRLVDSELGEIPEGWEVGVLDDAIELLSGGTPKTSVSDYWGGDIPWYTAKDAPSGSDVFVMDTERTVTQLGVENSATRILDTRTTIISARGTVGRLACLGVPMAMNQTCYGIRGAHGYPDFFTYWNVRIAVDELQTRTHGTIFDTITRQTFTLVETPLPPIGLALEFEEMVGPAMAHILNNLKVSRALAAQRDVLLPGLVSGKVRVGVLYPR